MIYEDAMLGELLIWFFCVSFLEDYGGGGRVVSVHLNNIHLTLLIPLLQWARQVLSTVFVVEV